MLDTLYRYVIVMDDSVLLGTIRQIEPTETDLQKLRDAFHSHTFRVARVQVTELPDEMPLCGSLSEDFGIDPTDYLDHPALG